ncbi:MAG: autotransporter domain-containing protein [Chthoniobacteraceae bacterium]|nr:autotransporter domain-containing protein [Chthoniobacteraceae bacterium]
MKAGLYKKPLAILVGSILPFISIQKSEASAILPGFDTNTFDGGWGSSHGNDDGSTALISLGFSIKFFGESKDSLYINNNGNVTFDAPLSAFTPFDLTTTNKEILAPFFGDVDTRQGALVTYGTGTVDGHQAFGVNWPGVGYFSQAIDKVNIFQLVIIDRSDTGAGNWDFEFNYSQIDWETGDASGGTDGLGGQSARAGFSLGTGIPGACLELPGSSFNGYLLDSGPSVTSLVQNSLYSNEAGQYVFSVRNGEVTLPPPATWMGNVDNLWSSANWSIPDQPGLTMTVPTSYTDVVFSGTGATNENTLLDRDFMIKSLTVNSPNAVTISGTNTLTILGTVGTTGITVNSGAGPVTINTNLILGGGSQTITVNNAAGMTINGVVDGVIGLEKSGTGTLLLTAENAYTGDTVVNSGTLQIGNGTTGSIQPSSAIYTGSTGTLVLDLADNSGFGNQIPKNDGTLIIACNNLTLYGSIGGIGNLVQDNTGTTLLTGINTYTGTTTINQGVLQIGNGIAGALIGGGLIDITSSGALILDMVGCVAPSQIINNGSLTLISPNTMVLAGAISGTGGLVQDGIGLTVLTGANTYTGATVISQGTLQIGNGTTGTIAGTSGITVGSAAALVFNLPNNTNVTQSIGNDGLISSIASTNSTLSGIISGTGSFVQNGLGTITLTNVNTYTGSTTIASGALQLSGSASIFNTSGISIQQGGALILDSSASDTWNQAITNNGMVVIQETAFDTFTLAGPVSGSGSLIKTGTNTLVLSGTQTYTGLTVITAGTLRLDGTSALPGQTSLQINSGAALELGGSQTLSALGGGGTISTGSNTVLTVGANDANSTFGGEITGSAAIQKVGTGVLNLTGNITTNAPTSILGGGFLVNGSLQGDVLVLAGMLGGSGIIHGNVTNQAMVSPGNSPGVLTISGNYTQTATGTLFIQIASKTAYDQLVVGGTATLGGALQVVNTGHSRLRGASFAILTAEDGLVGTFADISSAAHLKLNVLYDGNSVILQPLYRYFGDVPGMTPNERAVANAVDRMMDTDKFYDSKPLTKLGDTLNEVSTAGLPGALETIVPTDYVILPDAAFALSHVQTANLERRMEEIRGSLVDYTAETSVPSTFYTTSNTAAQNGGMRYIDANGRELCPTPVERRLTFFLNGSGDFVDDRTSLIDGNGKFSTGGVSTGADYRFNDHVAAGLTAGYANTDTTGRGNGSVGIDSGDLTAYATAFNNGFFVNGILGVGTSNYDLQRESFGGMARGDTTGMNFNALLGGGYSFTPSTGFSAGPIASVRYSGAQIDGFSEHGSLAPLNIEDQNKSSVQTTLGFQVAYEFPVESVLIKPQGRVQWRHEYANDDRNIDAAFQGGSPFTVSGPSLGSDGLLLDLGATVQITPAVGVYAYYSGDIGASNYTSNAFYGGLQLSF